MAAKKRKLFICPEVSLPEDLYSSKRTKTDKESKGKVSGTKPETKASKREEFRNFMNNLKEFNAKESSVKKKFTKDDILTKLGAPPPKQMTMPFKMKMGLEAARKKREIKLEIESKEAGLVSTRKIIAPKRKKGKK